MVPKAKWLLPRIALPVSCGQTGWLPQGRCSLYTGRPDPGLWTLCLSDVGPVGRLSPSALVVIGTRHCWRGMVRETTRSTERSNARRNRRFLNFLWAASLGSRTSYARWDNGHKGNSPENGTCRTIAVVNLRQGSNG